MAEVDNFGGEVSSVLNRYQQLQNEQRLFATEWQEIADYVTPRKNSITVERSPGQKRTQRLYESTALDCRDKLASSIHGTLMPAYLRWFSLRAEDKDLMAIQSVAQWMQDAADRHRGYFTRSNLDQESHEVCVDLVSFGTGCLFAEEAPRTDDGKFGGFRFRSVNCGKYCASEGPDGRVNTLFRHFPMTVQSIKQKWLASDSPDAAKVPNPKELTRQIADQKPDRKLNIIHAVFPAAEKLRSKSASRYMLMLGKCDLSLGTFDEFPFMVPRWAKIEDETYGRSPSHDALPDIRSLNMVTYLELRGLAKHIDWPFLIGPDVVGPVKIIPGGQTVVRGDPRAALAPFPSGGDFQMVNVKSSELKASIRALFYYDQLQLPQGPQMTAEEVTTRLELMYRLLGPTAGRIEAEFLRPLIDRTWAILLRAHLANPQEGILPEIPDELNDAMAKGKVQLRVVFEGPLARAQKAADVSAIQSLGGFIAPIAQLKPDVLDVIDFDEGIREFAADKGVPARIIRDAQGVAKIRADRAQQQAQQQQAAAIAQAAQAAGQAAPLVKAGSKAPEPGSPVAQLMNPNPAGVSSAQAA